MQSWRGIATHTGDAAICEQLQAATATPQPPVVQSVSVEEGVLSVQLLCPAHPSQRFAHLTAPPRHALVQILFPAADYSLQVRVVPSSPAGAAADSSRGEAYTLAVPLPPDAAGAVANSASSGRVRVRVSSAFGLSPFSDAVEL